MANEKYLDYEGVKYLWSKINGKVEDIIKYESVIVKLSTNQTDGEVTSATVTVTIDGVSTNHVYNNTPITFKVVAGKRYEVTTSNIDNYLTPTKISNEAVAGITRNINLEYKAVKLVANITGLADTSNAKISVTYSGKTTQLAHGGSTLVPYNTLVSFSASSVEGYTAPELPNKTFTSGDTFVVEAKYEELILGLFVVDKQGNRYTSSDWSGDSANVDYIAVYTDTYRIGIAPFYVVNNASDPSPQKYEYVLNSSGYNVTMSNVELVPSPWDPSLMTNSGETNTTNWVNNMSSKGGEPAFSAALNYRFANGKRGYIPSIKDFYALSNNYNEWYNCMSAIWGAGDRPWSDPWCIDNSVGDLGSQEYGCHSVLLSTRNQNVSPYKCLIGKFNYGPYNILIGHTDVAIDLNYPVVVLPFCTL